MARVSDMRQRTRCRGFSLFELIFASALFLLVSVAVLTSITGFGFTQKRTEVLFTAAMILDLEVGEVTRTPYDQLAELSGEELIEQNGYTFTLSTTVSELPSPPEDVKQVTLELRWNERTGEKTEQRTILRSQPW